MTTFVSPQMGKPLSHPYLIYEAFPERYLDTMQDVQTTLLSWLKDGDGVCT